MDFKQNYFELLGIVPAFDIDLASLADTWRALQKGAHPDRFAGGSDQDKRLAVQWTAHINAAYDTLKNPLSRAIYLLKIADQDIEHNPPLPGSFLMAQIELREELEELEAADDDAMPRLERFRQRIGEVLQTLEGDFRKAYPSNLKAAELCVYKMQFIHKLEHEAESLEERLLDY